MRAALPQLVGRDRELEVIDELLRRAPTGEGGVLTFSAEPGGGKTTLLRAARERADAAGFRVLSCCGIEWEAELPFSGLHELLSGLFPLMEELPDPQREGLDRAFAREAGPLEGLNVYVGALSLVLEATRASPVLLVVDDLQWLDHATEQALAFVARRLEREPVAMIVATRPGGALKGVAAPLDVPRLGREAVIAIARECVGRAVSPSAADDLMRTTEGNPLALIETLRVLGEDLSARAGVLDAPPRVGALIEQAFAGRVNALGDDARRAAEVVAASVGEDDRHVVAALARLGVDADALAEGARAGILEHGDGRWRYSHPILRSVVHQGTPPDRLRAAHAALGAVSRSDAGLAAWHAAAAATGPHEPTAKALEVVGERFGLNGGALATASALEKAADLTPDPDLRADRLLRAGLAARLGSGSARRTIALMERALAVAEDPALRVRIEMERAIIRSHTGDPALVEDPPIAVAQRAFEIAPDVATLGLRTAAVDAALDGDGDAARSALVTLNTLLESGRVSPAARAAVEGRVQGIAALFGVADEDVIRRLAAEPAPRPTDPISEVMTWSSVMPVLAEAVTWIEEFTLGDELARAHADLGRRTGDVYGFVAMRFAEAEQGLRVGEWSHAKDCARDAIRLSDFELMASAIAPARAVEAAVDVLRGETAPDLAWVEQVAREIRMSMLTEYVETVRGLAGLTAGDAAAAIRHFDRAHEWKANSGQVEPCLGTWPVDRVDALIQAGDPRAAEALDELRQHAARGRRWASAAVPWFEGMLAGDDEFAAYFDESLVRYQTARAPFEEARARLAFGRRLAKVGCRDDARVQFEAALATFERLEAEPWAARARRALGVSAAPAKRGTADRDALTPHERQVAELVAAGASNKDVAGELFISPKTVEAHLSRIYRKLEITSRTQLAARWSELSQR